AWTLYATNNGGNWALANTAALAPTYLASVPTGPVDALYFEVTPSSWTIGDLDDVTSSTQANFNGAYIMLADSDVGRAVCAMIATMAAGSTATPTKLGASATDVLTTDRKFDCAFTSYSGGPGAFPEPGDYMYVYYRAR
ncbi:MAG TPA: hypothetical protein PKW15_03360, partial [Alphaproteobacteria bacterium]|nr:hypothetical protein [Alphaproteobacteria bacterium]